MEKLKNLITNVPTANYSEWFEEIAKLLFCNYLIDSGSEKYKIKEVEFYYYNENHKDETTYGFAKNVTKLDQRIQRHKKAQCQQLTWFFHYSGVDLVIGKHDEPGGVLIRAIENVRTKERIKGPLVVLLELLNQQIDIEGQRPLKLELVPANEELKGAIAVNKRVGLGIGDFREAKYNYSTDEQNL